MVWKDVRRGLRVEKGGENGMVRLDGVCEQDGEREAADRQRGGEERRHGGEAFRQGRGRVRGAAHRHRERDFHHGGEDDEEEYEDGCGNPDGGGADEAEFGEEENGRRHSADEEKADDPEGGVSFHGDAEALDGGDCARPEREEQVAGRLEEERLRERVDGDVRKQGELQEIRLRLSVKEETDKGEENRREAHVFDGRVGEQTLVVRLANHEDGRRRDGQETEREHGVVAEGRGVGGHDFADADDGEERAVEERARKKRGDGRGGFGVGIGQPRVEGRKARLRAVAREDEGEARLEPGDAAGGLRVEDEHRAEEREANADRADEEVFPHGLQRFLRAVVGNERRGDERRQFDGHPHERKRRRQKREEHGGEEEAEADVVDLMRQMIALFACIGFAQVEVALNEIRDKQNRRQNEQQFLKKIVHCFDSFDKT